jgi:hypothetical protein
MIGAIIFIAIIALFVWGIIKAIKKQNADKLAAAESQAAFDRMTPAEQSEILQVREREKKYFSGKYIGGHPNIGAAIPVTSCQVTDSEVTIFPVAAKIPIAQITNVTVEDASTVEKRITATRLLTVGVFAFAAKKKKVHVQYYVSIAWGAGKIGNETIFEFEGTDAQSQANALRNVIVARVNEESQLALSS